MSIDMVIFVFCYIDNYACSFIFCCQHYWMLLSSSFKIFPPIMIPWMMPWHFLLCCILQALFHIPGSLLLSVCWILVLGKIYTCSALCFWFWYVGYIRIYMGKHSASSVFCYWVRMLFPVIKKWNDLFCCFDCWLCLCRHQWVQWD